MSIDNPLSKFCVYLHGLKRIATIAFVSFYLLASSGIMVGQHLCMGRVKETALFKKVEKQCGMSMEMHKDMKGCCDNEWSLEKVEDDQQISVTQDSPKANYHLLYEVLLNNLVASLTSQEEEIEIKNTGPPDLGLPDFFILYHSLKIPSDLQS